MKKAIWNKGKRTIKGYWSYNWAADNFIITIHIRDTLTGDDYRQFTVYGDVPEWNGWKRL